jgi:hypothetical protein
MSHSTVLVVLSDADVAEHGIEEALAQALAPFDENKETPQYIAKTRAELIEGERAGIISRRDGLYAEYLADPAAYREKAKHNPAHFTYISEEFPQNILPRLHDEEFLYAEATKYDADRLNEDGDLLSTYNPLSKWDWYSIGGRWSGSVLNATETIHHEAVVHSPTWTDPAWDEQVGGVDYLQKKDLVQRRSTFAFLDRDGQWHEKGRMGWFGMVADEQEQQAWDDQLTALVDKTEDDDWLVLVDVHI